jgi:cellulose synthase/poly-beta-1,6-N-acetylglucosamine synthase-like glycosyltransferase
MKTFFWGAIFSSGIIFWLTIGHLIRLWRTRPHPPTCEFSVAVIVPCKGNGDPDFENNLLSIIHQDYVGPVQYVFCVESQNDAALPILRGLEHEFEQVSVCIAGLATQCAQKTYNIVKGMALVKEVDIFLFADADVQPHTTWLQEMVAPFRDPQVGAVTGCFRRIPMAANFRLGNYLAGLFSASIAAGISNDRLKGLWGGSLAVRKSLMEQYRLQERLATNIVDDIAIMQALRQYKIKRSYVPSCTLKSYCDMSIQESIEWFVRQLQFAQIYLKDLYLFFHIMIIPYALSILATPIFLIYGLVVGNWLVIGVSLGFLLSVIAAGLFLRLGVVVNPANASPDDQQFKLLLWLLVTPLAFLYGGVALFKTHLRVKRGVLTMYWRDVEYRVDVETGHVLEVIR